MSDSSNSKNCDLKIKQICVGPFDGEQGGRGYSVIGLGEDGAVYRYDAGECRVRYCMAVVNRVTRERGGRRR